MTVPSSQILWYFLISFYSPFYSPWSQHPQTVLHPANTGMSLIGSIERTPRPGTHSASQWDCFPAERAPGYDPSPPWPSFVLNPLVVSQCTLMNEIDPLGTKILIVAGMLLPESSCSLGSTSYRMPKHCSWHITPASQGTSHPTPTRLQPWAMFNDSAVLGLTLLLDWLLWM